MTFDKLKGLFSYLPIIVFLIIVLHHCYWIFQANLSPWLGGGYGMFSTTDYGPSRYIMVYGLEDNIIKEQIEIPESFSNVARKLRSLPNINNLQELALEMENYLRLSQYGFPHFRIEVWSTRYHKKTLIPSFYLLNKLDHKLVR